MTEDSVFVTNCNIQALFQVVVVDKSLNCIKFFLRSGALLSSFVTQGEDGMVYEPRFFCLDTAGNILISDLMRHNIKILSPSGQLIHSIGKIGHEEESCIVHSVFVFPC